MLAVLDTISDPGGGSARVNDDVAGHSTFSAWVLDGATVLTDGRLLPGPPDAAWLAATKAGAVVVNTMPMLRAG